MTILPGLFLEGQQIAQGLGLQVDPGGYLKNCWENCWKNPPGFVHPPLADSPSFYSAHGGRSLISSISSLSYSSPHSGEELIFTFLMSFWLSGKKTKTSRNTLVKEDGEENFERTGVH